MKRSRSKEILKQKSPSFRMRSYSWKRNVHIWIINNLLSGKHQKKPSYFSNRIIASSSYSIAKFNKNWLKSRAKYSDERQQR